MSKIYVDTHRIDDALAKMQREGRNLFPYFRGLRSALAASLKQNFERREGPEGGWAPRAKSSIEHALFSPDGQKKKKKFTKKGRIRKKAVRQLANQLGRLKTATAFRLSKSRLEAYSEVDWAEVHQEGGRAGRGGKSEIPRRTFLWFTDDFLQTAEQRLLEFVLRPWQRAQK